MKLKSGLVFVIAAVAFGAQARDMNSIQQSGELKVGVPGDYAPLAFHNKAGELVGYDVDMAKDLGKRRAKGELYHDQLAHALRRPEGR